MTSTPITFTGAGSASWFNIIPQSGTIAGAQSTSITVTPSIAGFTTGVYPASIVLTFGDGSTQTVAVLLVSVPFTGAKVMEASDGSGVPSVRCAIFGRE